MKSRRANNINYRTVVKFIYKSALMWLIPTAVIVGLYVYYDPMEVLRWNANMYKDGFVPNKGNITLKQFEHFNPEKHFDSFIVGSSVSIFYKIEEWKKYLPEDVVPFHFDTSGMTIRQYEMAINYILENADTVKHAMIVMTPWAPTLSLGEKISFIDPIELSPDLSGKLRSHFIFFKTGTSLSFLNAVYNHNITGMVPSGKTADFWDDPQDYYSSDINEENPVHLDTALTARSHVFNIEHPNWEKGEFAIKKSILPPNVNSDKEQSFKNIANALREKCVDYVFIVVPDREYRCINPDDDKKLKKIFGSRYFNLGNEMDYLAFNEYEWYDETHFRSGIASKFMKRVYNKVNERKDE